MRCALLVALVACGDNSVPPPEPAGSRTFLTPTEHLARASLALRGVRPSVDELRMVADDPSKLPDLVDGYLHTPEFGTTIRELHDAAFVLVVHARDYTLPAVQGLAPYTFDHISDSIYGEPLRLIEDVVMTDQPYTTIVTADYTMADPIVATAWNLQRERDGDGWTRAHGARPSAGILGSPALFMRYRSAAFNYNRGRANAVSRSLLCHDFLDSDVAIDTSVDLSDPVVVANALVENPTCAGCHQTLDPLAAYFWPYAQGPLPISHIGYPYAFYDPTDTWGWFLTTNRPPGYFGQSEVSGLDGLGAAIAADPRFARCAAIHFATYLTQSTPAAEWIAKLQTDFTNDHYNARHMAKSIVLSDEFRLASDADPTAAESAVGYRKLRPAQLARMVEALTGYRWTADSPELYAGPPSWRIGDYDVMADDHDGYNVLAGGTDNLMVTQPATTLNATTSLVTRQLAFDAASFVVSHDAAGGAHTLFQYAPDAAHVRDELANLHARIFSELVTADDPSLEPDAELFSAALAQSGDARRAWIITLTAMLSDLKAVYD